LTNQASAEFARSTGGQFITVTKSGGNDFHGTAFEFFRNRKLNSLDNLQKLAGDTRETNPRLDQNRYGFNIGGPLYIPRFGEGGDRTYHWRARIASFSFSKWRTLAWARLPRQVTFLRPLPPGWLRYKPLVVFRQPI
jgi:hypothetical protein